MDKTTTDTTIRTIKQIEHEIIHPQLDRIRLEEMQFGSFWRENTIALFCMVSALALLMLSIPYLQVP